MRLIYSSLLCLLLIGCAVPCPRDEKVGSLKYSSTTIPFVKGGALDKSMSFKEAKGKVLEFKFKLDKIASEVKIPVETLCERGDFLDKTTQIKYFAYEGYLLDYESLDGQYTLNYKVSIDNVGDYGKEADTLLYETVSAYGQKLSLPAEVGNFNFISSLRGNDIRIKAKLTNSTDNFTFLGKVTLQGKVFENIYATQENDANTLRLFIQKEKGIVAFTTKSGEVWLRI
jgi:hypothetical protein